MNSHPKLSLMLAISLYPTALPAAVVLSTGFESPGYAVGNLVNGANPVGAANTANTGAVIANDSTATPFGPGNQFLAMNGNNAQFTVRANGVSELSTFSFDLYEPGGAGAQTGTLSFGLGIGTSGDLNAAGGYAVWSINNGAIGVGSNTTTSATTTALVVGRAYRAFVLYNGSASAQTFSIPGIGTSSIGIDQTALLFYDTTTGGYIDQGRYDSSKASDPTGPGAFKFRAFSSSKNEIYIDNFIRDDTLTLAVPEPSAAVLALLGSALAWRRRVHGDRYPHTLLLGR